MKYLCGNSYTVNKNPKHINMLRVYFTENVFSHPDFTVGSGIPIRSPDQPLSRVMDYTIGRDFHPATKTSIFFYQDDISILCRSYYNSFSERCLSIIDIFFTITTLLPDISCSTLCAGLS